MVNSASDCLAVEVSGAVALVTLNRPDQLNALSHSLMVELRADLARLDDDPSVRAIVLTGAGRAFCAGADLRAGPSDAADVLRRYYNPLILDLDAMSTPLLAAVNGLATGAGVSLVAACDMRVAASRAFFQLSFTKVGLVPDAGATWALTRQIGPARAAQMALLAERVSAATACTWGFVNEVVEDGAAVDRALELARALCLLAGSVSATRRLLRSGWERGLAEQLEAEAVAQAAAQASDDFQEARAAFAQKRAPVFSHGA